MAKSIVKLFEGENFVDFDTNPPQTDWEKIKDAPRKIGVALAKQRMQAEKAAKEFENKQKSIEDAKVSEKANRHQAGEFGEGKPKLSSDPETQGNQKPLTSQEIVKDQETVRPSGRKHTLAYNKDIKDDIENNRSMKAGSSDPEAQGNQKPLTSEETVKDQENTRVTNKGFNTKDDIDSETKPTVVKEPGFLDRASQYVSGIGKQAGDLYNQHSGKINLGIGAAALGGLGYAAYKKLKNDRAAKKANAKMMA